MNGLLIRPYRMGDAKPLGKLFHNAVRYGAKDHYTRRQRMAWSPKPRACQLWAIELYSPNVDTFVAEWGGRAVGFMTLAPETGHLDFAYVAPNLRGAGVANALYHMIEGRARTVGLRRLETEASHMAERFFLRRGWHLLARQEVVRNGIKIPNARMEKYL